MKRLKKLLCMLLLMCSGCHYDNRVRLKPETNFEYVTPQARQYMVEKIYLLRRLKYEQDLIDKRELP